MKANTFIERGAAFACTLVLGLVFVHPAFAQLNTSGASNILDQVSTALTALGVAVCTLAIIWAGYKVMWQHARVSDVAHILIGALMIGLAGTLAGLLMGKAGGA